jgi:hypothetical protein
MDDAPLSPAWRGSAKTLVDRGASFSGSGKHKYHDSEEAERRKVRFQQFKRKAIR